MAEEQNGATGQGTEGAQGQGGRTYTQAEVDTLVNQRVAAATQGFPSAEELTAFRSWQQSQQQNQQNAGGGATAALTKERDDARRDLAAANAKVEQFERESFLRGKGVPEADLDYYAFKIGQLVTKDKTFEAAAGDYLKEHKPQTRGVRMDTSAKVGGSGGGESTANETMNAILRGARR